MVYDYISRTYGVDFKPGERIAMDGKPGTVIRPHGDPQYVRVRFDGQKHTSNAHPTWRIERLPATPKRTERTMTDEELQAAIRKRDAQQEARDIKKAARLGTLAAQMDRANFRQETLRQKLADRRRSEVV